MVLERLTGEVSDVDPDRPRSELHEQPTHPGFEQRRSSTGGRRPARVRPAGDVEDALPVDLRQVAECVQETAHELRQDGLEVGLGCDLRRQSVSSIELDEGLVEQLLVGWRPTEGDQAREGVTVRRGALHVATRQSSISSGRSSASGPSGLGLVSSGSGPRSASRAASSASSCARRAGKPDSSAAP